jgi:septum formation protein
MLELGIPVVLASASPRRAELLATVVRDFEIVPAEVDEEALTSDDPWATASGLASAKAHRVARNRPDALVIGGDTVVALRTADHALWKQLGKPQDAEEAAVMLGLLSGRTHTVITGVTLVWPAGSHRFVEASEVTFRQLAESEIRQYAASGEPLDKAGGYAIQGGAAGFVERLEGSWENVVGLPIGTLVSIMIGFPTQDD